MLLLQPLTSSPPNPWEGMGSDQIGLGAWYMTRSLFSNQTGGGNRGCSPKSGFPQIDWQTQGPGAKKPREPWCNCSHTSDRAVLPHWHGTEIEKTESPSWEGSHWRWFLIFVRSSETTPHNTPGSPLFPQWSTSSWKLPILYIACSELN